MSRSLKGLLALAITAGALAWTLRGVDRTALLSGVAQIDWLWVAAISLPAFLLNFACRASRWLLLTRGLGELGWRAHFRAVAVGFMVNNLLPFRAGEFARCWFLARGSPVSTPALFGTVVVERLFDFAGVAFLALVWMLVQGPEVLGGGAILLWIAAGVFIAPLVLIFALQKITGRRLAGLVPAGLRGRLPVFTERLEGWLADLSDGGRSLTGPGQFAAIFAWTLVCWVAASIPPFWAALSGSEIDLPAGVQIEAAAAMTVYVAVGVAVPAVPGFFGPFHAACWLALEGIGVEKAQAVAVGTAVHLVFWVSTTAVGALCLRAGGASLGEARTAVRSSE